jgi:hypothetical protein
MADRAIYILESRRFPCAVTCEILRAIPGTNCYVVDAHIDGGTSVYATESELTGYGPDDSCDGWGGSDR